MTMKRRAFVLSAAVASGLPSFSAFATVADATQAIEKILRGKKASTGRVTLVIPPLVENGNLVTMKVSVVSPMTQADHVQAIHIVAEGNPLPNVVSFYLSPRAGRAAVTTRIRLGDSQRVRAIAQMSDGSVWQGEAATLVTLAACTEV
ncbi:MAG: SoxY-related AACIE arm protein [Polaromonas sp.]|nr:SoxY-related AACIE arm protein [Polaromonas sp.]